MKYIALFSVLAVLHQATGRQVEFCYAEDDDPYLYMASKTAYQFVRGVQTRYSAVPDCQPVQIWMLIRHGTRYPKPDTITKFQTLPKLREQIVYNHEQRGNGHLCERDLDNLKQWNMNPNLRPDMAQKLTPSGAEDAGLLARRLQSNFPELLQPNQANITSENYKFRSTDSQRTQASMESFMEGLFGSKRAVIPEPTPVGRDNLLKPHKNCSRWTDGAEGDPSSDEEHNNFLAGPEIAEVVQNISRRLGFQYILPFASIRVMYDACRFEKAWTVSKVSAWCAPFTAEDLRVLEYAEDLRDHYVVGNGRKINTQLGCPPLQDMFNHFKQLERGDSNGQPKGIFYFTHYASVLTLLTSMGIAEDPEPLLATNYKQMAKRQFRTSLLGPFNANLAAIFYRCRDTDSPNKVLFYLQEKPLMFEGCQVGLCDWEYLKNKLGSVALNCDQNFCANGSGVSASHPLTLFSVLVAANILVLISQWSRFNRDA